jgi:hypothetical protein
MSYVQRRVNRKHRKQSTYLEYHAAQLRGQEELLPLADKRVNHEVFSHIYGMDVSG